MSKIREVYEQLGKLLKEEPNVGDLEFAACGATSRLNIFRDSPDGPITGLSLEDEAEMKGSVEFVDRLIEKAGVLLSEKHREFLIQGYCWEEITEDQLEALINEYKENSKVTIETRPECVTISSYPIKDDYPETTITISKRDLETVIKEVFDDAWPLKDFLVEYDWDNSEQIKEYILANSEKLMDPVEIHDYADANYDVVVTDYSELEHGDIHKSVVGRFYPAKIDKDFISSLIEKGYEGHRIMICDIEYGPEQQLHLDAKITPNVHEEFHHKKPEGLEALTDERYIQLRKTWKDKDIKSLLNEWGADVVNKGYAPFYASGSEVVINYALHIEAIGDVGAFTCDFEACRQAEKDGLGLKFIDDIDGLEKGFYIDTPENRMLCEKVLAEKPEMRIENWFNANTDYGKMYIEKFGNPLKEAQPKFKPNEFKAVGAITNDVTAEKDR